MRADVNLSLRRPGEVLSARAPRPRTSTRCASSCRPSRLEAKRQMAILEEGGRDRSGDAPVRSDASGTTPLHALARKRRMTIATSPIRTCCLWSWTRISWISGKKGPAGTAGRQEERFMSPTSVLPTYDAGVLVADQETAAFYETVAEGAEIPSWPPTGSSADFFGALNKTQRR